MVEKKRYYRNFHTFIRKMIKGCDLTINVTAECKDLLNDLLLNLSGWYVTNCVKLSKYSNKITIDADAVKVVTRLRMDISDQLIDYAHTVWSAYTLNTSKGAKKETKAGLYFPPARVKEMFQRAKYLDQKIGESSYIFLTAVLEYVFMSIVKHSINITRSNGLRTITGATVYSVLQSEELKWASPLFKDYFIAGLGYL